jgi:recombinational DNA repair protein (RecF pathway)
MPNLVDCVQCGEPIQPQDQYFSAEQGGVLCPHCGIKGFNARKISFTALRYFDSSSAALITNYRSKAPPLKSNRKWKV